MILFYLSLLIIITIGLLFFIYGFQKKSQLAMCFGGMASLTPIYYFLIGWNIFIVFVPPIALVISDLTKKKLTPTTTDSR